ncbi:MAG TPA: efflux RND transporter periplasmic adaptor subunit [Acidiphilium sp.]|uniref:efflux RND transporter periplasmic adaptor subunit n=1 Tax=unclassified Acidiphilium TaxID=2617493 RepID=UPI00157BA3C5|nr:MULTISPECIES: efflux RND transporter periplasmic adaptor subunit [unclassified Acidiphilium]HQT61643.1 efflux RND transporter periplasmic adaptor subunit [Acidiphilium sp.]HQU10618.1 efflux RND transporter periplasmic adaptor subunit [Acidiphilium sp.]
MPKLPPRTARLALAAVLLAAALAAVMFLLDRTPRRTALVLYGNVDLRETMPAFEVSGRVTRLLVQEGAPVRRGELLATLDATLYQDALAAAEADLAGRKAALAKLLAGSRPEEIAQARATMQALLAQAENAGLAYRRLATLSRRHAASLQDRDNARAAFRSARDQYTASRQAYLLAVKGPRAEDIAAARAALDAARAAVALARRNLDETRLRAPQDGVIEDRILETGDMASPATPVFTIALPSPLWVRAYVPETALGRLRPGMAASVSTDSFPGTRYRGWVGFISPSAEFTPRTIESPDLRTALVYRIRVYVCDPRGQLRLGMPATVRIGTAAAVTGDAGCGGGHDGGR